MNAINLAETAKKRNDPNLARLAHLTVVSPGSSFGGQVEVAIEYTSGQ